jgi:hypothetical protein
MAVKKRVVKHLESFKRKNLFDRAERIKGARQLIRNGVNMIFEVQILIKVHTKILNGWHLIS